MNSPTTVTTAPLLFLDTNVMHFARLYLCFAQKHDLPPLGSSQQDPDEILEGTYRGRTRVFQNHVAGRKIVEYLRGRCESGARVEFSPMSQLELVCGLLRGRAVLDAADEGIPSRMWNRMDEDEILDRLRTDTYDEVQRDTGEIEDQFLAAGIILHETDPQRTREIWSVSRRLLGLVFLDTSDCAVYASALLAEADELLTADVYFRGIVNRLANPAGIPDPESKKRFEQARELLIKLISEAIAPEGFNDQHPYRLPTAPKKW